MKRVLAIVLLLFILISYIIPISGLYGNLVKTSFQQYFPKVNTEKVNTGMERRVDNITYWNAINNLQLSLNAIESINDKREWFIAYKEVIEKYKFITDPPESIYDYFTTAEINLICRVVETECYEQDFDSKCNVASVVFNRIDRGGLYGDSVWDVITKPNQFAYKRECISEDTILAVEYAFSIEDTTNGCIGFHSNKESSTFNGWEYSFTDDAMHHFYKEREAK